MHPQFSFSKREVFTCCMILVSCVLQACAQSSASSDNSAFSSPDISNMREIRIDPTSVPVVKTSGFLDSIVYLPLETTANSAFGEVTQMEVTDKYFIIWDKVTNAILFFTKKGKFHSKISNKDKSVKVPYKEISQFAVNEKEQLITVDDRHSQYEYYYDLEGKSKGFQEKKHYLNNFCSFNGVEVQFWNYYPGQKKPTNSLAGSVTISKNGVSKDYLPYNIKVIDNADQYGTDQCFYNNQNGRFNFTRTYDYTVYSIDSTGKFSADYKFILPAVNTAPDDFLDNPKYQGKRVAYTQEHTDLLFGITDFYVHGENIAFRTTGIGSNIISIYNLKSGTQVSPSNAISDKKSYMLPFVDKRYYAMDKDGGLISGVDAVSLFKARLKLIGTEGWNSSLPPSLKAFFKTDNQQNPVLTIMHLKQKI